MITFNFTDTAFLLKISRYLSYAPHNFFRSLLSWGLNNDCVEDQVKKGQDLERNRLGLQAWHHQSVVMRNTVFSNKMETWFPFSPNPPRGSDKIIDPKALGTILKHHLCKVRLLWNWEVLKKLVFKVQTPLRDKEFSYQAEQWGCWYKEHMLKS